MPPKIHQGQEQMIIEGNPTITEQFENQNEIPVQLSSNCEYRNADKNVNVRNSRATALLSPILSLEWQVKENPPEFLTKWLPDSLMAKKAKCWWNYT